MGWTEHDTQIHALCKYSFRLQQSLSNGSERKRGTNMLEKYLWGNSIFTLLQRSQVSKIVYGDYESFIWFFFYRVTKLYLFGILMHFW